MLSKKTFTLAIRATALIAVAAAQAASAQDDGVTVEYNVAAKMRDGVTLRADIYRPKADGNYPVLLERTPYDRSNQRSIGIRGAARGYVVIVQDVRGRFASEGEWYPFRNESQDGYDSIEWAAALPYANGKVGMFGGSYVGATQFLAAVAAPPHLAGIFPVVTASNYHDGWAYQGGALEQWFDQSWTTGLSQDTLRRKVADESNALNWKDILPLRSFPIAKVADPTAAAPYYRDWLAHPNYDDYWKQISIEEQYGKIQVPVFNVAAWYDIFLGGSLRNYVLLKTKAGSEAARRGQRLAVTIGGHSGDGRKIGEVDFGAEALKDDGDAIMLDWYDAILRGNSNALASSKPVRIFVMGRNEWRDEEDWPLARAKSTPYYLSSGGHANSSAGKGALSASQTKGEAKDSYVYDPAHAVPTVGGPLCCDWVHLQPGPRDQAKVESRDDVLVYTTAAFEQETEVTGPVTLDLYASTSAVDTDFTAKLVDLWPNGFAQNLTEGILRLRYRNSQAQPEPAMPGEIYRLTVDLWATSNVFLAGHKLRLEISSSNFPRFDRNLNTGEDQAIGTKMKVATNTIYHDTAHPSALLLPIVP